MTKGGQIFRPTPQTASLQTPNLDQLVRAGANFTNAYTSAPQCVPARAGLLLGKVQNKLGIEKNGDSLERFAEKQNIAELLSDKGYTSATDWKVAFGPAKGNSRTMVSVFFTTIFPQLLSGQISRNKVLLLTIRK